MAIVYKNCEPAVPASHVCDPCLDTEKGGIRSLILIKDGTDLTVDSLEADWTAAIETGDVVIIPDTRGSYDGGTAKMGAGYGDLKEKLLGYEHVIQIKDPNFKDNVAFWDYAEKVAWRFGFRTDTLIHLGKKAGMLTAKSTVEEDIESDVVWNVEAKWFDTEKMAVGPSASLTNLFKCYEVTEGV